MIHYLRGDALAHTQADNPTPQCIVHCCNDVGGWGAGFVVALSNKWPWDYPHSPEAAYRKWAHLRTAYQVQPRDKGPEGPTVPFLLGQVIFIEADPGVWVANLIGQRGFRTVDGTPPIRYEAIQSGLAAVRQFCQKQEVPMVCPKFGAGLAGGSWDCIEQLIEGEVASHQIEVFCYGL